MTPAKDSEPLPNVTKWKKALFGKFSGRPSVDPACKWAATHICVWPYLGAPNLMVAKPSSQDTKQDRQESNTYSGRGRKKIHNQWIWIWKGRDNVKFCLPLSPEQYGQTFRRAGPMRILTLWGLLPALLGSHLQDPKQVGFKAECSSGSYQKLARFSINFRFPLTVQGNHW